MIVTEEKTAELALELGRSMTEMKNHLRQHIQAKIKEHKLDITFEMLEIMACLWSRDGIKQQEIADITIKDKSTMTYLVDNLVKRNMVIREADKSDKRNNLICLTKEGRMLQKKLHPWVLDMYSLAAAGSNNEEIKNALILVRRMTMNLKSAL